MLPFRYSTINTHHQVGHNDLQDLGLQACPACKELLQDGDHDMSQRRADKGTVDCHLGHAAREVVAMLITVLRNPRGQELLERAERAGCDHLRAQRVLLELLQVPL